MFMNIKRFGKFFFAIGIAFHMALAAESINDKKETIRNAAIQALTAGQFTFKAAENSYTLQSNLSAENLKNVISSGWNLSLKGSTDSHSTSTSTTNNATTFSQEKSEGPNFIYSVYDTNYSIISCTLIEHPLGSPAPSSSGWEKGLAAGLKGLEQLKRGAENLNLPPNVQAAIDNAARITGR